MITKHIFEVCPVLDDLTAAPIPTAAIMLLLRMAPLPVELGALVVSAELRRLKLENEGFYRRREWAPGHGRLLRHRDDLDALCVTVPPYRASLSVAAERGQRTSAPLRGDPARPATPDSSPRPTVSTGHRRSP